MVSILDIRTLLIGNLVSLFICVAVMALLWQHNRHRFDAIGYWLASFAVQSVCVLLIVLREKIPVFASVTVSSVLYIAGLLLLLTGFQRYLGRKVSLAWAATIAGLFVLINAYFTYVEPSLFHRNVNYSLAFLLVSLLSFALLMFGVEPSRREGARLVGLVMLGYAVVNLMRLFGYAFIPPGGDLFSAGTFDALLFLAYQILIVALTFSLVLMVNLRLHAELECDAARQARSDAAVRTSEDRLSRAELVAKAGNWELHLDSGMVVASAGAATIYGVERTQLDLEQVKAFPLPEYREALDAAMSALVTAGTPYVMDFRIRAADTGEIKDVHSLASFDREQRVVFGVLQDVTGQKSVERVLERLAQTDTLTGIANRRHFMELAELELSRASRYGGELSVLMVDIDHFKLVNDTHGHQVGDQVLQELGGVFRTILREVDIAGRIGGEEFAVFLPETGVLQSFDVAERLRRVIEETKIVREQGRPLRVTVSIGVTTHSGVLGNLDTLLAEADEALYAAKHQGRNRVCRFGIAS